MDVCSLKLELRSDMFLPNEKLYDHEDKQTKHHFIEIWTYEAYLGDKNNQTITGKTVPYVLNHYH